MHSSTPSSVVSRQSSVSLVLKNQLQELFATCKDLQNRVEFIAEKNDTLKETVNELQVGNGMGTGNPRGSLGQPVAGTGPGCLFGTRAKTRTHAAGCG